MLRSETKTTKSKLRVLLVTRSGANTTGGGHGHNISIRHHANALDRADCFDFLVPLPDANGIFRKVQTFVRLRHAHLAGMNNEVTADFERTLDRVQPAAVFFDSTLFGPLASKAKQQGCHVFIQSHNCEYDLYAGEAAIRGGLTGELLRAAFRAESQAIEYSDVVFTLSAYDRERMRQIYGELGDCRVVNPHVQALSERLQSVGERCKRTGIPEAVFLGSTGQHNRLACSLLTRRWTGVSARLTVIGGVGGWLRREYDRETLDARGVNVAGFVESLDAALRAADAMVCPMHLGSGIKVKIIDALANGCPVLASPEALNGFEFAQASGWVRGCKLDDMEQAVARICSADLSLQQLLNDTALEAEKQAQTLRSAYAAFGLAALGAGTC
jgi:glycosyltransferase involved in cell wall biosynthesis